MLFDDRAYKKWRKNMFPVYFARFAAVLRGIRPIVQMIAQKCFIAIFLYKNGNAHLAADNRKIPTSRYCETE